MKNLLKLTSVLILTASFFLASCSEDNMEGDTAVTMRILLNCDAGSDLPARQVKLKGYLMRYRILGNQPFLKWWKGKWFLAMIAT